VDSDPDTLVAVRRKDVDLDTKEGREMAMLDNLTTQVNLAWDETEIESISDQVEGFDVGDFGFEIDDLPQVVMPTDKQGEGEGEPQTEVKEDDFDPDEVHESKVHRGEVWLLGEHRLMCGDSTSAEDVARLMNGERADMTYTDPPYGMNLDTDFSSMQNYLDFAKEKGFTGSKKYDAGHVDDFHPEMVQAAINIGAAETFLWGADYFAELLPNKNDGSWIVWDKRSNNTDDIAADESSDKMYGSCFELCWSKKRHKRDIARIKWAGVFGTEQEPDHKRHHPTQKPVKLSGWFLNRYSKEGDTIVDIFGGSGSTLIACEQLHRKCRMMELDPHYCTVIIARWEKLTGQKAIKLNQ
jgi:DNA modification methylase